MEKPRYYARRSKKSAPPMETGLGAEVWTKERFRRGLYSLLDDRDLFSMLLLDKRTCEEVIPILWREIEPRAYARLAGRSGNIVSQSRQKVRSPRSST